MTSETNRTSEKTDAQELLQRIRRRTKNWLLEDDAEPADLACGLVFVAAEITLQLAADPLLEMPEWLDVIPAIAKTYGFCIDYGELGTVELTVCPALPENDKNETNVDSPRQPWNLH